MSHTQQGSIKWIVIIILALIVGSYFFDFSLKDAIEDEQTQENFDYVEEHSKRVYNNYLAKTVSYLWNDIFLDLLWDSFTENLEKIKEGKPTVFEEGASRVKYGTTADVTNKPIDDTYDQE